LAALQRCVTFPPMSKGTFVYRLQLLPTSLFEDAESE
jgi:hypothetical protein